MKFLIPLFILSAANVALACDESQIEKMAEYYMQRAAKSQGALTYIAGPGVGFSNAIHYSFTYRNRQNELQMAFIAIDSTTCTSSGWGVGTAREHVVR
jgi:hypothetical protein